jgi:predicted amidohydrolase
VRACTVAAIQLSSGPEPAANLARVGALTASALDAGADLVVLPENYAGIGPAGEPPTWGFDTDAPEDSEVVRPLLELSAQTSALLVLGGVPERIPGDTHTFNTALVLRGGRVVAAYRKIHRFEATMADGARLSESDHTRPGTRPVLVHTALGAIGLSICYDLRFPEHYRALVNAGAELLLVPSAFTHETGAAHWEVLLRARAIESQCWVVAPAQDGHHAPGRRSFGHSMIVDPWGTVVACASGGERVVLARLEPEVLERARARVPALEHRVLEPETSADEITLTESDVHA